MTDTPKTTPTPKPTPKHQAPTFPKDERVMMISMETKICYREHKHPEGHPERKCHLTLETLDARICRHCHWYGEMEKKQVAALTGTTILKMVDAMKKIQEEGT